jgi:hypothetical protein
MKFYLRTLAVFFAILACGLPGAAADLIFSSGHQPAYQADQFTDFVGLNASPFERYLDSGPFAGAGTKYDPAVFFDLGINHYRTGLLNDLTQPNAPQLISQAYDRYGASAMLLIDPGKIKGIANIVPRLKLYKAGSVDLIEGPNEVNNKFAPQNLNLKYKGLTDEAAGAAYMDDIYPLIKSDPATKNIGVVSYTAIFTDYHLARPCTAFDYLNMHSYQGYETPEASIIPNEKKSYNLLPDGCPVPQFIPTECGYNVQPDVSNGTGGTGSLRAQALNDPILLAEYFRNGIKRAYLFAINNADGYGLLENDQTTKRPSYYAIKTFMSAIKDSVWDPLTHRWTGQSSAQPRALLFDVNIAPPTVHSVVLAKRNGQYSLLIWNELTNFNSDTHSDIVNPPVPITIHFETLANTKATVLAQDETGSFVGSPAAIDSRGNLSLSVPSSVLIVEIKCPPAQTIVTAHLRSPTNFIASATTYKIQLSWRNGSTKGGTAGYFVYRNNQFIADTTDTNYADDSAVILPGLKYPYSVQAYDHSGNVSPGAEVIAGTPSARPDVICTDITLPSSIHAGDPVTFSATLKNVGAAPTPDNTACTVTFFVDGKYTNYGSIDPSLPLAPGESRVVTAGKTWSAIAGAHILRTMIDDLDRVSDESNKENNYNDRSMLVDATSDGSLSCQGDPAPYEVNLTDLGTIDWVHWGLGGKDGVNRKANTGTADQIGAMQKVGGGYMDATDGFPINASWSDGTPTAAQQGTHGSLWLNNVGTAFTFDAPADKTNRVLRVFVAGISGAGCTLTAHLSDSSAPDFVSSSFNGNLAFDWAPVPDGLTTEYTLRYHAASPGQKLVVTWALTSEPNQFLGQARLQAAALSIN